MRQLVKGEDVNLKERLPGASSGASILWKIPDGGALKSVHDCMPIQDKKTVKMGGVPYGETVQLFVEGVHPALAFFVTSAES